MLVSNLFLMLFGYRINGGLFAQLNDRHVGRFIRKQCQHHILKMYGEGEFMLRENNGHRCIQSNGSMHVTVGYRRYLRLYPGSSNWFMGLVEQIHSVNATKLLDEFNSHAGKC